MQLFIALRVLYTPHRGPVVVSFGPASLLRQLGLDTERIIVPFSSKDVNHIACIAHPVTDEWCVLLFVQHVPSFSDITEVATIGHSSRPTEAARHAVRGQHYRPRIKYPRSLPGRQWESNPLPSEQLPPTTIKTSATTETATYIKIEI